jgi:hypothetical protein
MICFLRRSSLTGGGCGVSEQCSQGRKDSHSLRAGEAVHSKHDDVKAVRPYLLRGDFAKRSSWKTPASNFNTTPLGGPVDTVNKDSIGIDLGRTVDFQADRNCSVVAFGLSLVTMTMRWLSTHPGSGTRAPPTLVAAARASSYSAFGANLKNTSRAAHAISAPIDTAVPLGSAQTTSTYLSNGRVSTPPLSVHPFEYMRPSGDIVEGIIIGIIYATNSIAPEYGIVNSWPFGSVRLSQQPRRCLIENTRKHECIPHVVTTMP